MTNTEFVTVPFYVEKDGTKTFFLPDCKYPKTGVYQIGKRDMDQQNVQDYWDALSRLLAMPEPRFRRKNRLGSNSFGTVTCKPGDVEEVKRSFIETQISKYGR